jgi:pimeloyl-ACP methyl ester carboxylesterase
MKSVSVAGVPRYYDEEGEGQPVILVHGSLSNARQWRKLSERLRGAYRVLSPDLYACAAEPGASQQGVFSFEQDCTLVAALVAQTGGAAHLLGHSYGGVVAAKAALMRPDVFASLMLIEPSCFHLLEQENQPEWPEVLGLLERQQQSARGDDMEASARGFIDYWMGGDAWDAMPESRRRLIALGVPKLAQDWRGTLDHTTRLADYAALAMPALVIHARDSRAPSLRLAGMIAQALPRVSRVEIGNGGHMSPLTNPEPVNEAVAQFINQVSGRG